MFSLEMFGSELTVRNIEKDPHMMGPDNRAMGRILSTTLSVNIKLPTLKITPKLEMFQTAMNFGWAHS